MKKRCRICSTSFSCMNVSYKTCNHFLTRLSYSLGMKGSSWFLLIALAALVAAQTTRKSANNFKDWKQKHGKSYLGKEKNETDAEKTFNANVAKIAKHNKLNNSTYKQDANSNADLTTDEVNKSRKGYKPNPKSANMTKRDKSSPQLKKSLKSNLKANLPSSLDYTR